MMKLLLGKQGHESIFLTKHQWDCGWYWGFGYIGNHNHHFHIDSLISSETDVSKIFTQTTISQSAWWIIRDLFIQAYALKAAAAVYSYGGYQTTKVGITDLIKSSDMEKKTNADLQIVLDRVWDFCMEHGRSVASYR